MLYANYNAATPTKAKALLLRAHLIILPILPPKREVLPSLPDELWFDTAWADVPLTGLSSDCLYVNMTNVYKTTVTISSLYWCEISYLRFWLCSMSTVLVISCII